MKSKNPIIVIHTDCILTGDALETTKNQIGLKRKGEENNESNSVHIELLRDHRSPALWIERLHDEF